MYKKLNSVHKFVWRQQGGWVAGYHYLNFSLTSFQTYDSIPFTTIQKIFTKIGHCIQHLTWFYIYKIVREVDDWKFYFIYKRPFQNQNIQWL